MSVTRTARVGVLFTMVLGMVALSTSPASAQVSVSGGVDVTNQYAFRGIRQNTEGVSVWPWVDFGASVNSVSINIGSWNAIHSQINEADFGTDNKWYESDIYGTLGFSMNKASLGITYTSYTSPADLFSHVKELSFKLSADDGDALGKAALNPYVLVAFELDDDGQADAGDKKGTYVELGVAPGYEGTKASLSVPVKVGLSASDYYEFGTGTSPTFGYFSIGGVVTVPMGEHANVHFGGEFQKLGDTLKLLYDDDTVGIASIGLGFSF